MLNNRNFIQMGLSNFQSLNFIFSLFLRLRERRLRFFPECLEALIFEVMDYFLKPRQWCIFNQSSERINDSHSCAENEWRFLELGKAIITCASNMMPKIIMIRFLNWASKTSFYPLLFWTYIWNIESVRNIHIG